MYFQNFRRLLFTLAVIGSHLLFAIGKSPAVQLSIPGPGPVPSVARGEEIHPSEAQQSAEDHHQPALVPQLFVPQPAAIFQPDDSYSGTPIQLHEFAPIEAMPDLPNAIFAGRNEIDRHCVDLNGSQGGLGDFNRGTAGTKQHLAPEVVLRFSSGCTEAEFANWKLSSRDKPRAQPAIPHGPLTVELLVDKPIDFVELMFDGKPLKPTNYASAGPLSYSLPCPAPGQHWLQARYLSSNIWSHYSNPIRFAVRLPSQPRIIAASDFDRDPTPLARNSMTSITTHSIKVYLADVNQGDNIVAYVDGKPLRPGSDEHFDASSVIPVQIDSHVCCRVFRVEGVVIPGVHKLTVRVVGCSGQCSITSQPSNAIAFHYYDEDIFLLRPGQGCNHKHDSMHTRIDSSEDLFANAQQIGKTAGLFHLVSYPSPNQVNEVETTGLEATQEARDEAKDQAASDAAGGRYNAAKAGSDENGVRRALENAKAAQARDADEWRKASSRIAEGEANASRARAESVRGPSSPFYFASAAHFPLREFGLRGEPLDRDGIIIYEDMAFHFDRDGNYEVHFRASAPPMPATMRLQFQIQPHRDGPWYTVTLAPIEFPYSSAKSEKTNCSGSQCYDDHSQCSDDSKSCCGEARECVCRGKSEILKRCYGQMGQDAKIRRSGTARIGFGVNVP